MIRGLITAAGLLALWEAATWLFGLPFYILPPPSSVALALWMRADLLAEHALITATEIVVGLLVGVALGVGTALLVVRSALARRWLLPVVIASQAIPVFALAPLLVLWFGYGLASKIVMAALVIYFPVATSFFDGLRTTPTGWMELARTMGASEGAILRQMRVPAALPALAQGLRIAAAVAPIGAVIGEWVGSGAGLGFLMLHANGRMQIDLLFAALVVLAAMAIALYYGLDALLRRLVPWQPETLGRSR
ncbi:putative hydroxymethylpyrimidine transport system permease protein [Stella humosa]|uniref:Putative hydroxymethylpyrimidine transport system permease protein n=1 Tax=Stella humosa TaxID=94 RepID=A0A3N1MBK5_9PROT|nr:ABC transporter permease [Stella humosa]ROQ01008.1 putative hydroxymethylpyrimidine transport system permease protein [Stella humosa]BBK31376.1 ABC transporter permease [Stella humosa]